MQTLAWALQPLGQTLWNFCGGCLGSGLYQAKPLFTNVQQQCLDIVKFFQVFTSPYIHTDACFWPALVSHRCKWLNNCWLFQAGSCRPKIKKTAAICWLFLACSGRPKIQVTESFLFFVWLALLGPRSKWPWSFFGCFLPALVSPRYKWPNHFWLFLVGSWRPKIKMTAVSFWLLLACSGRP